MTNEQLIDNLLKSIDELRRLGCAVTVFTPAELQGVEPETVENDMTAKGWDSISYNLTETE